MQIPKVVSEFNYQIQKRKGKKNSLHSTELEILQGDIF